MMIKNRGLLLLFEKMGKVASAAKTARNMLLDEPSLYISSQRQVIFIIQVADAFIKNDLEPASFHASAFKRHFMNLPKKLYVCQFRKTFSTFRLFLDTKIQ